MGDVSVQSVSDVVRRHAYDAYYRPALRRGEKVFSVNVGTVHKVLALTNRVPLVCAALKSRKFLEENGLELISETGPPSGQSTTVTFTYQIVGNNREEPVPNESLLQLRGIAKDLFRELGGGEAFIQQERKNFSNSGR